MLRALTRSSRAARLFCSRHGTAQLSCSFSTNADFNRLMLMLGLLCLTGHTAAILDGRRLADAWQQELAVRVSAVHSNLGRAPGLGVVLVGSRPDSRLYVLRKQEACNKVRNFLINHCGCFVRTTQHYLSCTSCSSCLHTACRWASRCCYIMFQSLYPRQT